MSDNMDLKLQEVASRIREMREIAGFTEGEMAEKTDVSVEEYASYEAGKTDMPFTFIHKCSLAFGVEMSALLELLKKYGEGASVLLMPYGGSTLPVPEN